MQYLRNSRVVIALSVVFAVTLVGLALALVPSMGTKSEPSALISGEIDSYNLDKLHSHKTPYVGDSSNVAAIAQLLPPHDSRMKYDHISLQTDSEPYSLTIYYVPANEITEYRSDEDSKPNSDFNKRQEKNVVILFSLIDNLGNVSFNTDYTSIDNGNELITIPRSNYNGWLSKDLWADNHKKLIEAFKEIDKNLDSSVRE